MAFILMYFHLKRTAICCFVLIFLLSSCADKEKLASQVVGVWEGYNVVDGIGWCFDYHAAGTMSLSVLQKRPADPASGNWHDKGRALHYTGTWKVEDGKRLRLHLDYDTFLREDRTKGAESILDLRLPGMYVVTDINPNLLELRPDLLHLGLGEAITSERQDACSKHFLLQANE